jgi:transposase
MRQQAVKAVREGQSPESVAKAYGVNIRTVFRWLANYANAVKDNSPMQFKFDYGLWTLSLIAELIARQFGHKMSLSSVSRIMKILGFSAQNRCIRLGNKTLF